MMFPIMRTSAALLLLVAIVVKSEAQPLGYRAAGTVWRVENPQGIWSGIAVNDPFQVEIAVESSTVPTIAGETAVYDACILAAQVQFGGVSNETSDFVSSRAEISDNLWDPAGEEWADMFQLFGEPESGYVSLSLYLSVFEASPPAALTSMSFPMSLDLDDFDSGGITLETGHVVGGSHIMGRIESLEIITNPVAEQDCAWGTIKTMYR